MNTDIHVWKKKYFFSNNLKFRAIKKNYMDIHVFLLFLVYVLFFLDDDVDKECE